jgi:ferredoxin
VKIQIDRSVCQGHAQCAATVPELYTLDDDGYSNVDQLEVPAGLEDQARRGAQTCPERAIQIVD